MPFEFLRHRGTSVKELSMLFQIDFKFCRRTKDIFLGASPPFPLPQLEKLTFEGRTEGNKIIHCKLTTNQQDDYVPSLCFSAWTGIPFNFIWSSADWNLFRDLKHKLYSPNQCATNFHIKTTASSTVTLHFILKTSY